MNDNKMWALVKEKPEQGLWLKRVQIPEVGPNDVKIKIHKNAICGTDVHIYQWNEWAQHTIPIGLTAGHEYVGEVVEVGAGVQGFKVGDLVSGEGHITCGKCRNCLEGHKENCKDAKGVGVNRNGAFAEYLVIPASNVWPCNPAIDEELYAIFDPFDIGLEMSGSQPGLSDMIHNMKHGGKIALLGLQRQDATVDLETVIFNGLNIRGIYGRKVWDTWYKMSTMIQAGLDISPIITHHFDIRDYEKGFEAMISGQSGKVILDWAHIND